MVENSALLVSESGQLVPGKQDMLVLDRELKQHHNAKCCMIKSKIDKYISMHCIGLLHLICATPSVEDHGILKGSTVFCPQNSLGYREIHYGIL